MTPEELASQVMGMLEKTDRVPISGPELGGWIKEREPELNLRSQFGGLRKFIETYCGGQVLSRGDTYYLISRKEQLAPPTHTSSTDRSAEVWRVFSNPNANGHIRLNIYSGVLEVSQSDDNSSDEWVTISRLTEEEYRQFARAFISSCAAERTDEFERVISLPAFWNNFVEKIKAELGEDIYRKMSYERRKYVIGQFSNQLAKVNGLSTSIQDKARAILERAESKSSQARRNPLAAPPKQAGAMQSRDLTMQSLLADAAARMSDAELRRVWIPLGALYDVISHRRA